MESIYEGLEFLGKEFFFLFDEYDFRLKEKKRFSRGFAIILVSKQCQIVFHYEAGWDVLLGPVGKRYDGTLTGWVLIFSIFRFLLGGLPSSLKAVHDSDADYLATIGHEMKSVFPKILEVCQSSEIMSRLAI